MFIRRKGLVIIPIPPTRDPFVNTPPVSLGHGPDGRERFWASTYNKKSGSSGVVVTEDGECRVYRLPVRIDGCESAAPEDDHTMWLCGDLSLVARLDLRTGKTQLFETGAPSLTVFAGMALDRVTGKLLLVGKLKYEPIALSFDMRRGKTAAIYRPAPISRMAVSFRNADGTWCGVAGNQCTGLRWDPRQEKLSPLRFCREGTPGKPRFIAQHVRDAQGRVYLPSWGWFNTRTLKLERSGPRPREEHIWFAARRGVAWGAEMQQDDIMIHRWNLASGEVRTLCRIRDCHIFGVTASAAGNLIAVNMFGVFTRHDGHTGALECSKSLPVAAPGCMDCICRIDRHRILGTPYIAQRFWTADLRTGKGSDCGRAAPGVGEILETCRIQDKIYMAAYTGGELMEYDPDQPARFPENPRVVATPPQSMRPVSMVNDGRCLWYISNKPYGSPGSVLTRFDARTGLSRSSNDPLKGKALRTLWLERRPRALYAGSCIHSDNYSAAAAHGSAAFVRFDPDSLQVLQRVPAGAGITQVWIVGDMGRRSVLVTTIGEDGQRRWAVLGLNRLRPPALSEYRPLPVACPPVYAGIPGLFVFVTEGRTELWDMRRPARVKVLFRAPRWIGSSYRCVVQDRSVHLVYPCHVVVLDQVLPTDDTRRR